MPSCIFVPSCAVISCPTGTSSRQAAQRRLVRLISSSSGGVPAQRHRWAILLREE